MGPEMEMKRLVLEKKKVPGISYAFADNGIELAVPDITHPSFLSGIDESNLPALRKESEEGREHLRSIPGFIKRYYAKRSFLLAAIVQNGPDNRYLNGMATLVAKLGPGLVGGGRRGSMDRKLSGALFAMALRMRLRDISRLQAKMLAPALKESHGAPLRFINIAGGTAMDSVNALIVLNREEPGLLAGRKISVDILDIDSFGPHFGRNAVEALKGVEGALNGLDIAVEHITFDWTDTAALAGLLKTRGEGIIIGSSEGGLFEYGSDEIVSGVLRVLHEATPLEFWLAGDVFLEADKVDSTFYAMGKESGMEMHFRGRNGLERLLEGTGWKLEVFMENNPNYNVFSIRKG